MRKRGKKARPERTPTKPSESVTETVHEEELAGSEEYDEADDLDEEDGVDPELAPGALLDVTSASAESTEQGDAPTAEARERLLGTLQAQHDGIDAAEKAARPTLPELDHVEDENDFVDDAHAEPGEELKAGEAVLFGDLPDLPDSAYLARSVVLPERTVVVQPTPRSSVIRCRVVGSSVSARGRLWLDGEEGDFLASDVDTAEGHLIPIDELDSLE